jgi:hypothetical protein
MELTTECFFCEATLTKPCPLGTLCEGCEEEAEAERAYHKATYPGVTAE